MSDTTFTAAEQTTFDWLVATARAAKPEQAKTVKMRLEAFCHAGATVKGVWFEAPVFRAAAEAIGYQISLRQVPDGKGGTVTLATLR